MTRMIKTVTGGLRRVLQPTAAHGYANPSTTLLLTDSLMFSTTRSQQLCFYCTKNHTQTVSNILSRHQMQYRPDVHKVYPSCGIYRLYTVDSKLPKSVDAASKVPLAKTAAVRRLRKKPIEEKEVCFFLNLFFLVIR